MIVSADENEVCRKLGFQKRKRRRLMRKDEGKNDC